MHQCYDDHQEDAHMEYQADPFHADTLAFREYATEEPLPLSKIQQAALDFLKDREDVVIFGAQAVNAYVGEPRMTQDIDLLALDAPKLAEALRQYLHDRFYIAIRIRKVAQGRGFRLYQVREEGNRHLVDIREVEHLPPVRSVARLLVPEPATLITQKIIAYQRRRGKPKAGTDWRDIALLLLAFPELKQEKSPVLEQLSASNASPEAIDLWREIAATPIEPDEEDEEFWP